MKAKAPMARPARIARKGKGWHPEEIKAAIRMRGKTMSELSIANGYHESTVRQVLRKPWPAIERLVADFLGVDPQEIWPERYGPDGMPNRPLFGRVKFIPNAHVRQRKNSRAA